MFSLLPPDLRGGVNDTSCIWVVDFPLATSGPSGPVLERHPMAMPHATQASAEDLLAGHSHSFDLVSTDTRSPAAAYASTTRRFSGQCWTQRASTRTRSPTSS